MNNPALQNALVLAGHPFFKILTFKVVFPCKKTPECGINMAHKGTFVMRLIDKFSPKAAKTAVIATMMAALPFAFNTHAHAQSNAGGTVAFNSNKAEITATKTDPEKSENTKLVSSSKAMLKNGHAGDAIRASYQNKSISIWIYTGAQDKHGYDAQGYAAALQQMFENAGVSPAPRVEFYGSSDQKNKPTKAEVYINGRIYNVETGELQPGMALVHPFGIGHNIQKIIQKWADENGVTLTTTNPQTNMLLNQ